MTSAPTLSTERLTLRALTMRDWDAYRTMWIDPRVTDFIGGGPRPTDVAWGKFCQGAGMWALMGYGYWAIAERATDAFIGVGGFARFERGIDALVGFPEIGWAFAADGWGRGYASEAVEAMTGWADAQALGETRCIIEPANIASVKVATRNGFTPIGDVSEILRAFRRPAPARG